MKNDTPAAKRMFSAPPDFQWGGFTNSRGAGIRYGYAPAVRAPVRGTAVIVAGRKESAEKYFELIRDLTERRFSCWIMDWRGQGGSDRYLPATPMKDHSNGFNEHIQTLHRFTQEIVRREGPMVLVGHSMGGHLALRYLKEHPGVFSLGILTAPMVDFLRGAVPNPLAPLVLWAAKAAGCMERYTLGARDWSEEQEVFETTVMTSDPLRFQIQPIAFNNNPALRIGGPTWGWVWHAFRSVRILNAPGYLEAITTPVLMAIVEKEMVADKKAMEKAVARLPACKRVDIPGAKHEIWIERDELRGRMLAAMDSFLAERLKDERKDKIA